MSFLTRIQNYLKKDELLGKWSTDDGTGFVIVMGSWIEIRRDGTGSYESWASGDDDTSYNYKGEFDWKRLERSKIRVQKSDSNEVEVLEYRIDIINGREELTSKQEDARKEVVIGFWDFAQVMFRK